MNNTKNPCAIFGLVQRDTYQSKDPYFSLFIYLLVCFLYLCILIVMQEDVIIFESLFTHYGGTYLTETYTMSPSAPIKYEARWNGLAIGIRNLIAVSIKPHKCEGRTI